MPSFLDFLLPKDGVTDDQRNYADTMGLINAGQVLANMSAPQIGGYSATPTQLIANGLAAYAQGGNAAITSAYDNQINQAKATQAAVQNAYDKQNLDWFNNQQSSPYYPQTSTQPGKGPKLSDFYKPGSLTAAQIKQESGGNPNAISPKGARGLMQIMPATGKDPGFGVKPLQNDTPEENVRMGQEYTNALLQKYGGNQQLALMAYNWGPGNVDNWMASGADPAKVPDETKQYVQNILGNTQQQPGYGNQSFTNHLYQLAEMQMRAGRPGAETLFSLAGKYDPALERLNGAGLPAAVQIANELEKARQSGNTQRVKDLEAVTKMYDKGYIGDGQGGVTQIPGYDVVKRNLERAGASGTQEGKGDTEQLQAQAKIVAKMPLLENDLNLYESKLSQIDPALMGPLRGKASYYTSPAIQDLTSTARSIALQMKDIYNLGSGQGFTDADRDYLDSIIGGAKIDPVAALPVLKDMRSRIQLQKDMYKQQADYYGQHGSLTGYVPNVGQQQSTDGWQVAPNGLKYKVAK